MSTAIAKPFCAAVEEARVLLLRRRNDQLCVRSVDGGRKLLQQGCELKLVEERSCRSHIRLLRLHALEFQIYRHAAVDRHQLLAQQNVVAVVLQRLAIALALHLIRAVEQRLRPSRTAG